MAKGPLSGIQKSKCVVSVGDNQVNGWDIEFNLGNQANLARLVLMDHINPKGKGESIRAVAAFWGPVSESYETNRDSMMLANSIEFIKMDIPRCRNEFAIIYSSLALSLFIILFGILVNFYPNNFLGIIGDFPIFMIGGITIAGILGVYLGVRRRLFWGFIITPIVLFFASLTSFMAHMMGAMNLEFIYSMRDFDASIDIKSSELYYQSDLEPMLSILHIFLVFCWLQLIVSVVATITIIKSFKKLVHEVL
jgi:hypothetical protein